MAKLISTTDHAREHIYRHGADPRTGPERLTAAINKVASGRGREAPRRWDDPLPERKAPGPKRAK